jgi:hypothetical protein
MVDIFTFLRPVALISPMTQGRGTMPGSDAVGADEDVVVQAAVENPGRTTGVEVDIVDGVAIGNVPDETVWAEAEDDKTATARTLIRSLFTGSLSIQNSLRARGKSH